MRIANMRRILVLSFAAALIAGRANAQPEPWLPERLTAGWTFTPAGVFGGMWDTNPTVRSAGNPTDREFVTTVNPRGELDFNGRRTHFNVGYSGMLEAYRNLDELTRYTQRGRTETRYQASARLGFTTRTELTMAPTTDLLEINGLPFERVGSTNFTTSGGFGYNVTPRMIAAGDYTFQWVQFDRNPQGQRFAFLRGGHSHKPSLRLEYRLTHRLGVGATWDYRHAAVGGGEQTFAGQNALGEMTWRVGRHTKVGGGAGLAYLHISSTGETRTGPSYRASVNHDVERAVVSARYERSFVPSFGFGGMTASQVLAFGVHVPFARGRMFASASYAYRRSDPLNIGTADFGLDSTWTSAAFGYYVARWLRMESFYNGAHQTSTARGNVERARIGIQFVTSKPVRIQ